MIVTLIAAMAQNRVIGRENGIPWDFPEDRKRFRLLTMGHPVIMGRKTFDYLPRPLNGRTVIVLSRNPEFSPAGCTLATTPQEALFKAEHSPGGDELFIAGGGEIYRQFFPLAHRIYLTVVHREVQGDATFPDIMTDCFTELFREELQGSVPASFICLERVVNHTIIQEV